MNRNLALRLTEYARHRPDAPAIIAWQNRRYRTWTFAEVELASGHAADLLTRLGCSKGDVVLLWQPMSAALYILMIGAWRAGLTVMFIDPGQPLAIREASARMLQPAILAGPWIAHAWSMATPTLRTLPRRITTSGWWPRSLRLQSGPHPKQIIDPVWRDEDDPALITFTSGSTGQPKAIVRSHGFLARQHLAIHRELNLREGQIDLTTMPIFLLANLGSGVTSVIPRGNMAKPGSIHARHVLELIRHAGITRGGASPAFWERLIQVPRHNREAMTGLRELYTGGGPVSIDLLQRMQEAAPAGRIVAVYGSTEAEPIASASREELVECLDFAEVMLPLGKPVSGVRVKVIPDRWGTPIRFTQEEELEALTLPPGIVGEIIVSGPLVIPGYWQGQGNDETKIHAGDTVWHRTGDAGCLDHHGGLWLAGRCSAKVAHQNRILYPFHIEVPARSIKGVRRVALATPTHGICLAVETDQPESIREIERLLSGLGWPDIPVTRVSRIPVDRRHNTKVDYPRLSSLLSKRKR